MKWEWTRRSCLTVLPDRRTKNFNLCASNCTDGTNHLYHPRFCERTVPTLISSGNFIDDRVKYRLVKIFPYTRVRINASNSLPKPSEKPCWSRDTADPNCKARVVRGDKEFDSHSRLSKGGTLREKEIFAQALSEFFCSNREPALYSKSYDLGQ